MSSSGIPATSQNVLLRILKQTDGNITRLAKVLSTTSNLETFYLVVAYTLKLVRISISRLIQARLSRAAEQLTDRLTKEAPGALLPGEALVATIETSPSSRLLRADQSIGNFQNVIDDVRVFLRLKSLLSMWVWGASTLKNPNPDPLLQNIAIVQVASCTGFAVLENAAYLASKGVIGIEPAKIGPMYLWSARFWTVHVLVEFVRLWRVAQKAKARSAASGGAGEKLAKKEDDTWWAQFYGNAAWAPLAVSWSLGENAFAGDAMIATLGGYAGWAGLIRAWKAAAV